MRAELSQVETPRRGPNHEPGLSRDPQSGACPAGGTTRSRTRAALAETLDAIAAVNRRHSPSDGGFERSGGLVGGLAGPAGDADPETNDAVCPAVRGRWTSFSRF